jgi:acyl-CoA synthetase (AMP-forming)/AMP-acid ligase II
MTAPVGQFAWVAGVARDDPAREAIVTPESRLSYRAFADLIARTAAGLTAAGLVPGARVAYLGLPGAGFLVSELATQQAGGVWMGLNPRYTVDELRHALADARPSLILVEAAAGGDAHARVERACATLDPPPVVQLVDRLDDLARVPARLGVPDILLSGDVALIVYTSGTTGTPKGACLTHAGVAESARLYAARYAHPGLRSLMNLPVNHVGSLIDLAGSALAEGGTLVTMPGFDPVAIPQIMREERLTLLGQVPAMHIAIESHAAYDPADYPHLRHLVWSGASMPRRWIEAHHGRAAELSTCYGQTECTGSVSFTDPGADIDTLAESVGRPAEPGLVRIVGSDGAAVADGQPGEIQVQGPLLMVGYFNRPEATSETLLPGGWLRTGDLGLLDASGNLRLVGRLKEMYKSGGYNVYPREVEAVLERCPGVRAAAVIAMPDPQWQEVGWAYLIAEAGVEPEAVMAQARASLANYKLPKRIIVHNDLPLLPIGKIDKRALMELAGRDAAG